jgi:hypothetical protein
MCHINPIYGRNPKLDRLVHMMIARRKINPKSGSLPISNRKYQSEKKTVIEFLFLNEESKGDIYEPTQNLIREEWRVSGSPPTRLAENFSYARNRSSAIRSNISKKAINQDPQQPETRNP